MHRKRSKHCTKTNTESSRLIYNSFIFVNTFFPYLVYDFSFIIDNRKLAHVVAGKTGKFRGWVLEIDISER